MWKAFSPTTVNTGRGNMAQCLFFTNSLYKKATSFSFLFPLLCCYYHIDCVVNPANAADAAVQSASTKTSFSQFVISHKILTELEFLTVPSLKVSSSRLPLCYGYCPTYWPNISYFFLLVAFFTLCSKDIVLQTPLEMILFAIVENRSEVMPFAVIQTITCISPQLTLESLILPWKLTFFLIRKKKERTLCLSMFLETSEVIPCWVMI